GTDAIGGVVLVEPAPISSKPGWAGELNLAGFSNNRMGVASFVAEHTFKKNPSLGFRFQGTYRKGGTYRIPGNWIANSGVAENNFSGTVSYRTLHYGGEVFYSRFDTHLGIYRGAHTGNKADLMNAINSDVPLVQSDFTYAINRPRQHVTHNLLKVKFYADNRLGMWNLIYGYQKNFRQEYDVVRVDKGNAQLNLTLQTHTLNLNLEHRNLKGIKGEVGVDAIFQDNSFQDGDRLFIPTYQSAGGSLYLIERYTKNRWTAEAGLRYDYRFYGVYNPEGSNQQNVYYKYDYHNVSGTLGLRYKLEEKWQWSLTMANAWRAPQANELFSAGLHHGAARIELGNKELGAERSYSLNFETKYEPNHKFSADIVLYSQLINNYIYLEPGADLLTIRGYFKTFNYKQTNAWLNGADLSFVYHWNEHFQTALKGATLFARDRNKNDWLILMPADRISLSGKYSKDLGKRFLENFLEINARYVFEQKRIPANFDSIDYPRPPAAYFLLDASAGTHFKIGRQSIHLSISAANLLNQRYRDYLDVFRYFIDQPGRNIVLRIRVPFDFKNHN
ncbi:MAG TPA: TonB-dependent receptor, partial [Flavipsychrobacter sp.]|nr:TonB-dependent receptor [Flavipsychrobacter sp.]